MSRRLAFVPIALVAAAVIAAAGYAALHPGPSPADGEVLGPGEVSVEVGIEHSRFTFTTSRCARAPPCASRSATPTPSPMS